MPGDLGDFNRRFYSFNGSDAVYFKGIRGAYDKPLIHSKFIKKPLLILRRGLGFKVQIGF